MLKLNLNIKYLLKINIELPPVFWDPGWACEAL